MGGLIRKLIEYRAIVLVVFVASLLIGGYAYTKLDIEAYPDPSPPLVEIITQNPAWSAEEMERQVTIPVENAIYGSPHLEQVRSTSIFGLSDVKLYFSFDSDYFHDREEVLYHLQTLSLPNNLQPELSPWSPIGEIYRYILTGPGYSLNELKATQDWLITRELKQVPGIIDVTTFGGTTRQYQVVVNPNQLRARNVTLTQVIGALQNSNANVGGDYLMLGAQNVNVRSIGLLKNIDDIGAIVVAEHSNVPVLVRDVAEVKEGNQPPLGRVGREKDGNVVEGIVLLQKNEQSLPALRALKKKVSELNHGNLLPPGMQIKPYYDRTKLINVTTDTVKHIILSGLLLVTAVLFITIGDFRTTLLAVLTIPFAVLFALTLMVMTGHSANLISIGAIDFGILVDASIVVLENVYRRLSRRMEEENTADLIVEGVTQSAKPVIYATIIILISFIPLFTMQGVPGKIFAPMSMTYGFALVGALIYAVIFAPVLGFLTASKEPTTGKETWLLRNILRIYEPTLKAALKYSRATWIVAILLLLLTGFSFHFIGGEFMPALEEGNLWIRATLPQDISFPQAVAIADSMRATLSRFPEVTQTVSQVGRPDDGTDVTTFNNVEVYTDLKPEGQWPASLHGSKDKLIEEMQSKLAKYPGVVLGFSQNIQDNVEEAMSGVKGENSLKLFGNDFDVLSKLSDQILKVMQSVPGVQDAGIFKVGGQPNLIIEIDRAKAARYGIAAQDINAAIQAAVGGAPITQVIQEDRRFDLVVRFPLADRDNPGVIRNIMLPTPDGSLVPLGEVADVSIRDGAFAIYREGGRRYVPIKFSVRGRDLQSTICDLQDRLAKQVKLPPGYEYTWAGEFDSLQKELHRLAFIVPISLLIILGLLYILFLSIRDALIVMAVIPFGMIGGVFSLLVTHTPFSISAAVGFTSVLGLNTLGAVVFLRGVRHSQHELGEENGLLHGSLEEMRPIVMACMCAALGLLPAALSNGIGAQAQQPLARVVVGGMASTLLAVLFITPLLARKLPDSGSSDDLHTDLSESEISAPQ
ncbi:MAG TPA: CusA/CzcA family heavy metal efflux RND transporter [Acidobacteriaceae bacterium]|nr:CusA/CzcA family heavy metal efflux RND transporter [Acidobacteriaceae bacterium]